MKTGYVVFLNALCEGVVPSVRDNRGKPYIFRTKAEAEKTNRKHDINIDIALLTPEDDGKGRIRLEFRNGVVVWAEVEGVGVGISSTFIGMSKDDIRHWVIARPGWDVEFTRIFQSGNNNNG